MKRLILGLACASAVALTVPALTSVAHAQAADPLTALKSRLSAGHGVSFSDTTKMISSGQRQVVAGRTGVFQFDRSGIAASDHTTKLRIKASDLEDIPEDDEFATFMAGLAKPERVVRVKNASYISGGVFGEYLPSDKTWLSYPGAFNGVTGSLSQMVNIAEPGTLKALLAHATRQTGGYAGKTTFGELYKVSPWFRASTGSKPSAKEAGTVVTWKLFVGSGQLPTRLTTTYAMPGDKSTTMTVDTRYTGWGAKVKVTAPPAEEVATVKELEEGGSDIEGPISILGG